MGMTSAKKDWNPRWPGCLVGLEDRVKALKTVQDRVTAAHVEALGSTWALLTASTVKMHELLQGQQPPDSQPGDYEFGPVLPVLWYDLPKDLEYVVEFLHDVFGLPESPITESQWEQDLQVLDNTGQVASDGSLVAHSDLAVADYCWVIAALEYLYLEVEKLLGHDKRHPFVKASGPIPLSGSPSSLTLALAGDWGSGPWHDPGKVYPAKTVLEQMVATEPDFMVHLGDVYYAGTPTSSDLDPDEEGRYFTKLWQAGSRGALALNSNHEMYSGANGLFQALGDSLFAVQGGATYFAIEIEDWLVLGLDSAYYDTSLMFMDGALTDPDQIGFIQGLNPGNKRVLVLTHHNGLLYTGKKPRPTGKKKETLWDEVCKALGKHPEVWYWGHIHNGIVYSSQSQAGSTLARCCGHGSLPFGDAYGLHGSNGQPIPEVSYYAHTPLPDPEAPPQKYRVLNGFATVCLERGKITERFYEQGVQDPVWEKTTTF